MTERKKRFITIQNVDEELFGKVKSFLETHRRIPSISALSKVSLESYLDLANKYGIDADWRINIPNGGASDTDKAG